MTTASHSQSHDVARSDQVALRIGLLALSVGPLLLLGAVLIELLVGRTHRWWSLLDGLGSTFFSETEIILFTATVLIIFAVALRIIRTSVRSRTWILRSAPLVVFGVVMLCLTLSLDPNPTVFVLMTKAPDSGNPGGMLLKFVADSSITRIGYRTVHYAGKSEVIEPKQIPINLITSGQESYFLHQLTGRLDLVAARAAEWWGNSKNPVDESPGVLTPIEQEQPVLLENLGDPLPAENGRRFLAPFQCVSTETAVNLFIAELPPMMVNGRGSTAAGRQRRPDSGDLDDESTVKPLRVPPRWNAATIKLDDRLGELWQGSVGVGWLFLLKQDLHKADPLHPDDVVLCATSVCFSKTPPNLPRGPSNLWYQLLHTPIDGRPTRTFDGYGDAWVTNADYDSLAIQLRVTSSNQSNNKNGRALDIKFGDPPVAFHTEGDGESDRAVKRVVLCESGYTIAKILSDLSQQELEGIDLRTGAKTEARSGLKKGDLVFVPASNLTMKANPGDTVEIELQSVPSELWQSADVK